ncbi:TetR family transcriptional regulator C-terminal domain-containing protein (plasmid) [Pseudoalteromonas espejiana]
MVHRTFKTARTNTRPWVKQKVDVFQAWIDADKMDNVDPYHLLFTIWSTTQYYAISADFASYEQIRIR